MLTSQIWITCVHKTHEYHICCIVTNSLMAQWIKLSYLRQFTWQTVSAFTCWSIPFSKMDIEIFDRDGHFHLGWLRIPQTGTPIWSSSIPPYKLYLFSFTSNKSCMKWWLILQTHFKVSRTIFLSLDVYIRVTGHLCGEFTSHRWIHLTKAGDGELWCFVWSAPE